MSTPNQKKHLLTTHLDMIKQFHNLGAEPPKSDKELWWNLALTHT